MAAVLTLGACNLPGETAHRFEATPGSCRIADDQQSAFMSRVADFPIPVHIDSSFSEIERAQVRQALASWNAFGRQLIRQDFFSIRDESQNLPDRIDTQNCAIESAPEANALIIVRSTRRHAPGRERVASPINAVGITFRCTLGDEAERQVTVIHADRVDPVQVESVVLHEMGHALGLDHSCDSNGGRGRYRSCWGLEGGHPYHQAVMYPNLQMREPGSSIIETKDRLTPNDMDRMACLYGPQ